MILDNESIYPNCGTSTGYVRHIRKKTPPCRQCKDARNKYSVNRYKKMHGSKILKPCGTYAAYRRHQRNNETPCEECIKANRQRSSKRNFILLGKNYNELQVIGKYGANCYLCNIVIDFMAPRKVGITGWENGLHIDHLIPISKGGLDSLENVRPTHALCNLKKWANV